jgi:hypothetical protein
VRCFLARRKYSDESTEEAVKLAQQGEVPMSQPTNRNEPKAKAVREHGIEPQVVKLHEAKKGFAFLPRRWVVERSFAWVARFRRLARDYERLPETVAALHFLVFGILMLVKAAPRLRSA